MRLTAIILVASLLVPFAAIRSAEDTVADEEAKQAEEEKAAEDKLGDRLQVNFTGKLVLTQEQKDAPDVVGVFHASGHAYLLKLENSVLLNSIKPYNGKEITLVGRPRNQGKYFLAWGVDLPSAPPVFTRTRGSL
jgi:hypothetical protein